MLLRGKRRSEPSLWLQPFPTWGTPRMGESPAGPQPALLPPPHHLLLGLSHPTSLFRSPSQDSPDNARALIPSGPTIKGKEEERKEAEKDVEGGEGPKVKWYVGNRGAGGQDRNTQGSNSNAQQ